MGETQPVQLQDTYWVTYIASMGQMLRSSMKVAEMYPGKTFPIKCCNVLLGALITNMQNCKKSANMKGWVIGKVLADMNTTFTQTIFQALSQSQYSIRYHYVTNKPPLMSLNTNAYTRMCKILPVNYTY